MTERTATAAPSPSAEPGRAVLVIALVIATSGLVYELLAATVASWVLGDSVTQFSLVVGGYLAALGLGSYVSRYVNDALARRFIETELGVALVGGLATPALFLCAGRPGLFRAVLYAGVLLCGALVGLEIPLLLRVLEARQPFRHLVARVLAYDHVGSLVGSLLFSFALMPYAGPLRAALACGLVNALVALYSTHVLRDALEPRARRTLRALGALVTALLLAVLARSSQLIALVERVDGA